MTSYKVFYARQGRLNGLLATPEDVFYESARLLDFLFVNPNITQRQVDSLWNKLLIDIRIWKADASEHDKRMVAGTVFQIVRAALTQHTESCYYENICDLLNQTTERELGECDKNEQTDFNRRLIEQSPVLCEWINQYDDSDEWLSDKIAEILVSSGEKEVKGMSKAAILMENKEFMRILQKAVEQGFCTQQGWQYHWKVKVEAAYFASVASKKFNLSNRKLKGGKEIAVSWIPFEALFGTSGLVSAFNDYKQCKTALVNEERLDKLFE